MEKIFEIGEQVKPKVIKKKIDKTSSEIIDFRTLKNIFEKKENPPKSPEWMFSGDNAYYNQMREFDKKIKILEHGIKGQIKCSLGNTFDKIYLLNADFHFDNDLIDRSLLNVSNIYKLDEEYYNVIYKKYKENDSANHYDYNTFKNILIFKNIIKTSKQKQHGKILIIFDQNLTVYQLVSLEKQFNYSVQQSLPWQIIFFTIDDTNYENREVYENKQFTNSFLNTKIDMNSKIYAVGIDCEIYNSLYQKINVIAKQTLYNPILCLGYYYKHKFVNIHLLP
tara:strand:+ start:966 stop:1805 length:840 start_codon:yes stop_codon:yes gene_type:complete